MQGICVFVLRADQRKCHRCELRSACVPVPAHVAAGWHHVLLQQVRQHPGGVQCEVNELQHEHPLPRDGQNIAGIGYDTMVVLTITGLQTPSDLFFRVEFGVEAFNHPRKMFDHFVHYMDTPKVGRYTTTSRTWAPQVEWHTSQMAPQWCVPTQFLWWCTSQPSRALPHLLLPAGQCWQHQKNASCSLEKHLPQTYRAPCGLVKR